VDFAFSDEQQGLREVVRDVLAARCTAAHLRASQRDAGAEVPGLLYALHEVGVTAIAVPEEQDGLGLGQLEVALALYELGYAGAPGPWVRRLAIDCDGAGGALADLRGATGVAAYLCGLAGRMIAMAVDHVRVREQFGQPVGSFQAVQHHLADARLALDFAVPLVWRAAWCLDNTADDDLSDEAAAAASMAREKAGFAASLACRKALQCHGAMGYAHEYDLQLYMKRAWALHAAYGDPASHRRRLAARLLG